MKIRTLTVSILGVLLISGVSPAQEAGPREPASPFEAKAKPPSAAEAPRASRRYVGTSTTRPAAGTPTATRTRRSAPSEQIPTEVRIFELKYARPVDLGNMISRIFRADAHLDRRLNRLIVSATKEQMQGVESLIKAMDVPSPEASTRRDTQDLIYRIYMFEIASENQGMRAFSARLQTSARVSSQEFLDATTDKDLRIIEFRQFSGGPPDAEFETLIQGKAASDESVRSMVEKFPESRIIELRWDDDETFTNKIEAAQYTQLPEQLQKHIRKFLGNDIQTVGYWFGNLSVPGGIEAPIGPWTLNLQLESESDQMFRLTVDVEMPRETHSFDGEFGGRHRNDEILSNTMRAKIGKPVIIGYSRQSYGTRKMGAMVIVPEADSF